MSLPNWLEDAEDRKESFDIKNEESGNKRKSYYSSIKKQIDDFVVELNGLIERANRVKENSWQDEITTLYPEIDRRKELSISCILRDKNAASFSSVIDKRFFDYNSIQRNSMFYEKREFKLEFMENNINLTLKIGLTASYSHSEHLSSSYTDNQWEYDHSVLGSEYHVGNYYTIYYKGQIDANTINNEWAFPIVSWLAFKTKEIPSVFLIIGQKSTLYMDSSIKSHIERDSKCFIATAV